MKNRKLARIIALILFVGVITSCGSVNRGTPAPASPPGAPARDGNFNPSGYPILNEPATFTSITFQQERYLPSVDGVMQYDRLFEYTNLKIDVERVVYTDEGVALYLAAGDYKDWSDISLTPAQIIQYAIEADMFVNIADLIPQYMPNMMKWFAEYPQMKKMVTQNNGGIYTFPGGSVTATSFLGPIYYRSDYLNQLGLNPPETTDEFYDMLVAAREADICKGYAPLTLSDGLNDLIEYWARGFFPFFGDDVAWRWTAGQHGDEVLYNSVSDQYRRYLDYMRRLYADGLLEREIFTQDSAVAAARFKAGEAMVVTNSGNAVATITADDFPSGEYELEHIIPLTSEWTNVRKTQPVLPVNRGGTVISTKVSPEMQLAILRWLDCFYAMDEIIPGSGIGITFANFGIEGESFEILDDGTYRYLAPQEFHDTNTQGDWFRQTQCPIHYFGATKFFALPSAPNTAATARAGMANNMPYQNHQPPNIFLNLMLTPEDADRVGTAKTDIEIHTNEMTVAFVSGTRELNDANWDAFVSEIDSMGLQMVLDAYKTALERWNAMN